MIRSLTCAFLLSHAAMAGDLRLAALDGDLGDGIPGTVLRFHGEDAVTPMAFLGSSQEAALVTADVYLDGDALAAPLAHGLHFQLGAPAPSPGLASGCVSFPHPDTSKPVVQLIRLCRPTSSGQVEVIQTFKLRWISKQEARNALAQMLEPPSGAPRKLVVFGKCPGLREQLRAWHFDPEDLGEEAPLKLGVHVLALGEIDKLEIHPPTLAAESSALVVRMLPGETSRIWRKDKPGSRLTEVTLRHATDWRQSPFLFHVLTEHLTPEKP